MHPQRQLFIPQTEIRIKMDKFGITQQYPGWAIEGFGNIDFADFYMVKFPNVPLNTVDHLGRIFLSYEPLFLRILLRIRDVLVQPFGLKTGDKHSLPSVLYYEKGSVLVYFHVWQRDDNTIVLEEKDKHLNFRVIFMIEKNEAANELSFKASTLVHFNNIWGKLYFLPVRPVHEIIMKSTVKQLIEYANYDKH